MSNYEGLLFNIPDNIFIYSPLLLALVLYSMRHSDFHQQTRNFL